MEHHSDLGLNLHRLSVQQKWLVFPCFHCVIRRTLESFGTTNNLQIGDLPLWGYHRTKDYRSIHSLRPRDCGKLWGSAADSVLGN